MGEQESILISIKKLLGIDAFYEAFDTDVIIHINTVFGLSTLFQTNFFRLFFRYCTGV